MTTRLTHDALMELYELQRLERKPGWDQKVRTAAINSLVDHYYGTTRGLNTTVAFLQLTIAQLEGRLTDPK